MADNTHSSAGMLNIVVEHLRCPSCRHYYHITDDSLRPADNADISHYVNTKLADLPVDLDVQCPACLAASPLASWVLCAHNPLDFFDTDNLCKCGGEMWYTISQEHPRGIIMCDRCGQVIVGRAVGA